MGLVGLASDLDGGQGKPRVTALQNKAKKGGSMIATGEVGLPGEVPLARAPLPEGDKEVWA